MLRNKKKSVFAAFSSGLKFILDINIYLCIVSYSLNLSVFLSLNLFCIYLSLSTFSYFAVLRVVELNVNVPLVESLAHFVMLSYLTSLSAVNATLRHLHNVTNVHKFMKVCLESSTTNQ